MGLRLFAPKPVPVWTWSLTDGMHRDGQPAEAGTNDARGVLDFIAALSRRRHLPPDGLSRAAARVLQRSAAACGTSTKAAATSASSSSSRRRCVPFRRSSSAACCFSNCARPTWSKWPRSFAKRAAIPATKSFINWRLPCWVSRWTKRATRCAARWPPPDSLGPESLPALLEEKRLLINRSGVIEFIADGTSIGEVGGLDGLKTWLLERRKLFELRDSLNTEIVPKGLLLMGIPGCGKSLAIKAIASYFQLPLYRVDMIEIFSGRHGKPEGAFVEACKLMEDLVPAVLWFDEIEMGITSTNAGGEQGRIFAFFLTWMQEKARGLFVAATANRIDLLPAEMIRKGRFDEVFFVDLPLDEERLEIFKIHLTRRGVDLAGIDLGQLTEFTKGWSGAEVEQCVVSAITKARLTDTPITGTDLIQAAVKIVPLSRTMEEQINHIRGWAFERAVRASRRR